MARIHFVVEGQTEEAFVKALLIPHLSDQSVFPDVRRVFTSRDKRRNTFYRGGLKRYDKLKADLTFWMKQDQHSDSWFTTMVDLYALPADFPDYARCRRATDPHARVQCLESALAADIGHPRLIPYIQLHEFEALLFSNLSPLGDIFSGGEKAVQQLASECQKFKSPEHIDDDPNGAPSKRIIAKIPQYEGQKVSAGPLAAQEIGLDQIRQKCPHFDEWLTKLENLAPR